MKIQKSPPFAPTLEGVHSDENTPPGRPAAPYRRIRLVAMGFILLVTIISAAFWLHQPDTTTAEETDTQLFENSIAVMPFRNLGEEKTDYLCIGARDQIHSALALIEKLKVIATSSADRYKDTGIAHATIAEELGVNYLLEGSVLVVDKQTRIDVKLVNAIDRRTVWTKSYQGRTTSVFGLFNQVAKDVSLELNQKPSDNFDHQNNRKITPSLFAYNEYQKGRQLILSRKKEQLLASVEHLNRAVQADPEFSDAFAQLSVAYSLMADNRVIPRDSCIKLGEKYALTAIRLDPDCGMAFAALANLYDSQQKWDQAEDAYKIALKHQPNDAMINYWFSLLLRTKGRVDEAMHYSLKATVLDPLHPVIQGGHILNCLYAKETQQAEKCINEGKLLFNDSFAYHWACTFFYTMHPDYDRALEHAAETERLNPNISLATHITFLKARGGRSSEVLAYLEALPETPENDIARSVIYSGLRNKEKSIYYLLKATDRGKIPTDVKVSPFYDLLRDDPRFGAAIKKIGL